MAKDTLGDRHSAVNIRPSAFSPSAENYPQNKIDWLDHIQNNLDKVKAVVTVAQWGQGLDSCSEGLRHNYLLVVEELLDTIGLGVDALQAIYNQK